MKIAVTTGRRTATAAYDGSGVVAGRSGGACVSVMPSPTTTLAITTTLNVASIDVEKKVLH
jgi:hypothetical protein